MKDHRDVLIFSLLLAIISLVTILYGRRVRKDAIASLDLLTYQERNEQLRRIKIMKRAEIAILVFLTLSVAFPALKTFT